MKKKTMAMILALCLLLTGCASWMDGQYVSVKPHTEQGYREGEGVIEVRSYTQIYTALEEMVENGVENIVLSGGDLGKNVMESNTQLAIRAIMDNHAIGAYAVDDISYEHGTAGAMTTMAVTVSYNHNRSEILRIKRVKGMNEAIALIENALKQIDASLVVHISDYKNTDYAQIVQDYAMENPDQVMEIPLVTANIYPNSGSERLVELVFNYQTSRESLKMMQNYVQPVFTSAALYVIGEEEEKIKFSKIYAFLMDTTEYTVNTSITPAYSLLRHGVGDSKAFATVYARMCARAGITCLVVSGTRDAEPRFWNIILEDGIYYHVDLLQSSQDGQFRKLSDGEMSDYVWDYDAYPACGVTEEPTNPEEETTGDAQ